MKTLKELYSSPTTEFFEVRFEDSLLVGTYGAPGAPGSEDPYDPDDDEEDLS